jgi:hypothetical protein
MRFLLPHPPTTMWHGCLLFPMHKWKGSYLFTFPSLSLLGMYLSFLSSLPRVRFVQQQATSAATTRPQPPSRLQQRPPLQQHVSSSIYFLGDGTHEVSASSSTSVSSSGGAGSHARVQDIDEEGTAPTAMQVLCMTRASVPIGEGSRLCTGDPLVLLFLC